MIEKFRKIQHSWAIKAILILTALSFMSLFGVSGYVNSAGANKTIVDVDGEKIGLNEIHALFNRDTRLASNMLGQPLNLSNEAKNSILIDIVNTQATNLIIQKISNVSGIDLPNEFLKRFIQSQQQFMDENNIFSFNLFQRFLKMTYQSEASYVNNISLEIKKQMLVSQVVSNIAFPKAYDKYLKNASGVKKIVEYITIDPKNLKVGRKISSQELDQYYQDFAQEFMAQETRDVSYIYIKAKKDYEANIELLEEIEDTIGSGKSLKEVAKKYNASIKTAKKVSQENTSFDASVIDAIFSYNTAEISNVIETESGEFAVVEVVNIYPQYQKPISDVKSEIIKLWTSDEQLAIAQEISADVANDIDSGDNLAEIAKRFNLKISTTKPIAKAESFATLSPQQSQEVYSQDLGSIKVFNVADSKILAVIKKVIKSGKPNDSLLSEYKNQIKNEASQNLINSYAKDLDVKIYLDRL